MNSNMQHTTGEKPINWLELIEKYGAYWKWILLSLIMAIVLGLLFFRTQKDKLQFKATVLITDNSSGGQMSQLSILKQLDNFGMSKASTDIYNERQVIHSKELIKKVVAELNLYYSYSTTKYLKPIELYNASPIEVRMDYNDMLKIGKSTELDIAYETDGKFYVKGKIYELLHTEKFSYVLDQLPATIETKNGSIQIYLRDPNIVPEEKIHVQIHNPIGIVRAYQTGLLTTEVPKDGDIVNITLIEGNREKGIDFLRCLIDIYNQDAIDQINKSANFTAVFIDSRLNLLKDELTDVERNLQAYKQDNRLTNIEVDAGLYLQRSNLYDQKQNELEIQLQLIEYIEDLLKQPENKYALIPNLGLTDVGLVAIIQEYNKLLVTRERVASGSSANNPTLQSMDLQIQSSRSSIQNSIATSRKGMEISIKELGSQNEFLSSQLQKIPQQEREFIEIKRQQEIKASLYMFLLQKREEASLSMAVTVPKARLLDAADSADKTSPRLPIIMLAFMFLGIFIPIVILYLKFTLTRTFNDRKELESITDVPIISELARHQANESIIDHNTNANSNAELIRLLRSKIQFLLGKKEDKVILVTSTEMGEGKTFVSINLAVSFSLTKQKVLLIGLDLRKPMLANHFGISDQEGVSSYLSGMTDDYRGLIKTSAEYPNLDIIHGGIIPPNPNELILSDRFDKLIAEVRKEYDYIVLDTAPVGLVSDTFLIDRVADMSLYVCRADYSDKRNMEFVKRIYDENTLKRLYLVVNDVDMESKRYGGRYAYGYSYAMTKNKK